MNRPSHDNIRPSTPPVFPPPGASHRPSVPRPPIEQNAGAAAAHNGKTHEVGLQFPRVEELNPGRTDAPDLLVDLCTGLSGSRRSPPCLRDAFEAGVVSPGTPPPTGGDGRGEDGEGNELLT